MINDPLAVFLKDFSEDEPIVFEWVNGDEDQSLTLTGGIFDNSFTDAATGETVLDTTQPRVTALESEAKNIPREATTTIKGKTYSVTQVQPDGTGFAIIELAFE